MSSFSEREREDEGGFDSIAPVSRDGTHGGGGGSGPGALRSHESISVHGGAGAACSIESPSAEALSDCAHSGWLGKRGYHLGCVPSWKRRFFILKGNYIFKFDSPTVRLCASCASAGSTLCDWCSGILTTLHARRSPFFFYCLTAPSLLICRATTRRAPRFPCSVRLARSVPWIPLQVLMRTPW
jgi:hypothetical protein